MHELSVATAVLNTALKHADDRPVSVVSLRVGQMRQVVPDSLVFSWEMVTAGTDLQDSELVVDYIPAVVTCQACGAQTTLEAPVLVCATCESTEVELVSGNEFDLASFDVTVA